MSSLLLPPSWNTWPVRGVTFLFRGFWAPFLWHHRCILWEIRKGTRYGHELQVFFCRTSAWACRYQHSTNDMSIVKWKKSAKRASWQTSSFLYLYFRVCSSTASLCALFYGVKRTWTVVLHCYWRCLKNVLKEVLIFSVSSLYLVCTVYCILYIYCMLIYLKI